MKAAYPGVLEARPAGSRRRLMLKTVALVLSVCLLVALGIHFGLQRPQQRSAVVIASLKPQPPEAVSVATEQPGGVPAAAEPHVAGASAIAGMLMLSSFRTVGAVVQRSRDERATALPSTTSAPAAAAIAAPAPAAAPAAAAASSAPAAAPSASAADTAVLTSPRAPTPAPNRIGVPAAAPAGAGSPNRILIPSAPPLSR